ncbi:MAG: N-acetylmuramoyl-L-alanine amidase [Bacteroidetes bacterium]|nr:N-acetylmuramoyl-L-alanine amidase [Bacteroidota bacterium]
MQKTTTYFPVWFFLTCLFILTSSGDGWAQKKVAIKRVVIDAGHGGQDPGTIGKRAKEKNVALAIALKLGNMIQKNCKDVKVIFTRDRDVFVELNRRAQFANDMKADLFISIHCNANNNHSLKGAETYVMGLHRTQANLEIAKTENASILMEADYANHYDGFNPNSDESYITFSMFQDAYLEQSMEFAADVQKEFEQGAGMNDRGVRQAGFLVLYKTTMPSVLVETGYLSNPSEETFMVTDKGQEYIASSVFRAFKTFKQNVEHPEMAINQQFPKSYMPKPETTQLKKPASDSSPAKQYSRQVKKDDTHTDSQAAMIKPASTGQISIRVQVASMSTEVETSSHVFSGLSGVRMYKHNGMYKYTVGDETSMAAAERLLAEVKAKGFKDAFVVYFKNDSRITKEEALSTPGIK